MKTPIPYAELICKTNFSFLEGASKANELVERAAEIGLSGLAVTDRNGVYAMPRAYHASKAFPQLKLITGAELTVGTPVLAAQPKDEQNKSKPIISHLVLLAQTRFGYASLCRILTAAHADKPKGEAHLTIPQLETLLRERGTQDLIAIPRVPLYALGEDRFFSQIRPLFGDRFYLPISRFSDGLDHLRMECTQALSRELEAPLIVTNDVHTHLAERQKLQDALTSIRLGVPLPRAGKLLFSNSERYLKSPAQMTALFSDMPDALALTHLIAESCLFSPSELRYRYPSEWIPASHTPQSYLDQLTWEGARKRYPQGVPDQVQRQIRHELGLVAQLQFSDYFLTIHDIVEFARGRGILCQGRGSAANSVVCYCLGITSVDPVRMDLLFERFISAERGEPPDIDVDFEHERREEVIQYIYQRYGRDRAAMVSAVVTFRSRMARREMTKALDLPLESLNAGDQADGAGDPRVEALTEEVYGFPRHLSIHSGGFTLSADPIIETVPVEPARMEGRTIIQWDKLDLEIIGLLKVDVLALGILSALQKTFNLLKNHRGIPLSLATIPEGDPQTYAMIQAADTVGTFQIESRAQMSMLPRLLPKNYYDLVVQVAIVRPGPIQGGLVHPYLRRRRGLEAATTPDPRLDKILAKTLGVPLFQEQVMKIAIEVANFTPGEADQLRRAIGAWRSTGSINQIGHKLMHGLVTGGLPQSYAEQIFREIQGFAEYGFPESHAASFALLAYASSYLKCHYPAEFCAALLNSQPMGFYAPHTLVEDAKRHGARFLPIDLHHSAWDCTMEGGAVRLGFRMVSGLSEGEYPRITAAREARRFVSIFDFVNRTHLTMKSLEPLAMAGVFRDFTEAPREALWELLAHHALTSPRSSLPGGTNTQLSLFSGFDQPYVQHADSPQLAIPSMNPMQKIQVDYESHRLSLRGHPMQALREMRPQILPKWRARDVRSQPGGRHTETAGLLIVRQRPPTAGGITFATLEDETGLLDLVIKPEIYQQYGEALRSSAFLRIGGRIQRDGGAISLNVQRIRALL